MARPTKLTTELIEEISNWLKMGYYQEDAATMVGISQDTWYW
jgi:predicted XRE-type DNA-binding protein